MSESRLDYGYVDNDSSTVGLEPGRLECDYVDDSSSLGVKCVGGVSFCGDKCYRRSDETDYGCVVDHTEWHVPPFEEVVNELKSSQQESFYVADYEEYELKSSREIADYNLEVSNSDSSISDSSGTVVHTGVPYDLTDNEDLLCSVVSPQGRTVNVYRMCTTGNCKCSYYIGEVRSQLKPCRFASFILLNNPTLKEKYLEVLWGVTDGFPIVDSVPPKYVCENYNSITVGGAESKMTEILTRELKEGIVSQVVSQPHCVHALGAVPKGETGIRNITDCSRPIGKSVNYHCESLISSFCFKSVEDVVSLLHENWFMSVIDIKAAYRAVPIREEHRKFQGFSWFMDGKKCWYVDNRLCFGLKLGPKYFNLLSNMIYDVLTVCYNVNIVNYLDDFITLASTEHECEIARDTVVNVLRFLGFHVAYEKLGCPSKCVTYLGIIIDSVRMELRLPGAKLHKLIELIKSIEVQKRVSKKNLESLGGLLSHCAHIVKGGRIFCKNVYKLYKQLVNRNLRYIQLGDDVKKDLRWWKRFCVFFNGSRKIVKENYQYPMVSDSSLKGFAVYLGSDWAAGVWHDEDYLKLRSDCNHIVSKPLLEDFETDNINVLELWPIVVGLKRWAHLFKDMSILVFTDNTQVMFMLINGSSVNETCCKWIREIFWITAIYNIEIIPKYINTRANLVADTLSRLPYPETAKNVISYLANSQLCCLDSLFQICSDQLGGCEK